MHREDTHEIGQPKAAPGARSWTSWALIGFLAIAGFLLFTEHRAHLFGVLPYLLLLACPLLHLFHHHGNRGGEQHHDQDGPREGGK